MSIASSGQSSTDSLNGKLSFEQDNNRIIGRDADNLPRLLILADGTDFVMKVAKPGKDATRDGDADMIFDSSRNVFKIVKTGTATLNLNLTVGGNSTVTVPHGLGFTPVVMAFTTYAGGYYQQLPVVVVNPNSSGATLQGRVAYQIYCYSDNTNIYFYYEGYTQGTGGSVPIRYYALQETAN